ncbi:ribbon-helix-helix protein, CopG family [Microbacterium sp.]|uniref:type II toxin-antitoxin system VapB family antitoxin n=1 Tax=Microbacterium sp. TaxID=51671 RepID=UPI0039E3D3E1
MTDVLIRNVSEDDLRRIDAKAERLGLSRSEFLRRTIAQEAAHGRDERPVTSADFERFTRVAVDLLDDDVMRGAWS